MKAVNIFPDGKTSRYSQSRDNILYVLFNMTHANALHFRRILHQVKF